MLVQYTSDLDFIRGLPHSKAGICVLPRYTAKFLIEEILPSREGLLEQVEQVSLPITLSYGSEGERRTRNVQWRYQKSFGAPYVDP